MQHEDFDVRQPAQRRDGRRAGVARGCRENRGAPAPLFQRAREQPAQHLQRDVFEGQRRAVEQLQQIKLRPDLDQRRDARIVEGGVCGSDIGGEIFI